MPPHFFSWPGMDPDGCGFVVHVRLADQDVINLMEGQLVVELEEIGLSADAKNDCVRPRWSRGLLCCMYELGGLRASWKIVTDYAVVIERLAVMAS